MEITNMNLRCGTKYNDNYHTWAQEKLIYYVVLANHKSKKKIKNKNTRNLVIQIDQIRLL